jgi:exodeoxyribonuclease VII small subunit
MGDSKRSAAAAAGQDGGAGSEGTESLSFEGALEQLEQTVGRLEEGEMPLEEALGLFEAGVKLSRHCNETLEAAERRIEILIADRGGMSADDEDFEVEPFQADDAVDEDDEEEFED